MFYIDEYCRKGQVDKLESLLDRKIVISYSKCAINWASKNGHLSILQFFKDNNLKFKYDEAAINGACKNGHIHILQFFIDNNFEIIYNEYAINNAWKRGHISVLEFFKQNNLPFLYYTNEILPYCIDLIEESIKNDSFYLVIEWWIKNQDIIQIPNLRYKETLIKNFIERKYDKLNEKIIDLEFRIKKLEDNNNVFLLRDSLFGSARINSFEELERLEKIILFYQEHLEYCPLGSKINEIKNDFKENAEYLEK